MRSESEALRAIGLYADTVRRVCLCRLRSPEDTEDILQEVLLKYIRSDIDFESETHEKAWILRVTINACNDLRRRLFRRCELPPDEALEGVSASGEQAEVLGAVLSLPPRYRDVIYLHYYEGYTAREIGDILDRSENTVYSLLARGRRLLKERLGGDEA